MHLLRVYRRALGTKVDPVVDHYRNVEAMLDTMITYQQPWLGYLK